MKKTSKNFKSFGKAKKKRQRLPRIRPILSHWCKSDRFKSKNCPSPNPRVSSCDTRYRIQNLFYRGGFIVENTDAHEYTSKDGQKPDDVDRAIT